MSDWRGIREGVGGGFPLDKGTGIPSRAIKYGMALKGALPEGEPDSQ